MKLFKKKSHWILLILAAIIFFGVSSSKDVELGKLFIAIGLIVVIWRALCYYIKKCGVVQSH